MTDHYGIPVCPILGVDIACVDMETLKAFTAAHLKELSGKYICVANVHTTVTAYEDEAYRAVQNGAVLAIPDGGPLSSVGRRRGFAGMQRTTGPSFMQEMLKEGYRHFFYGSTEETLAKMKAVLEEQYPNAVVAGMYSPPFRPLSAEEDEEVITRINEAEADFVWIGLGAPKQEYWMADHEGRVHGLMVGVGAAFDYLAGNIDRAPEWMQKHSLEWLYRLMQDPKRLFYRYFHTNTSFIWNAVIRKK